MKDNDTQFKYPISTQLLLKIGGIAFMSVGLFILKKSVEVEYIQILPIAFGSLFLIFGFMGFVEGFKFIIINEKGIEQKNLIKKSEIPKEQVKGYAEIVHKNSKGNNTQLVIFSNAKNQFIKIEKESWGDNYKLLLKKIKSNYKRVGVEEIVKIRNQRKDLYKNIGKGFGLCVFMFGLYQLLFIDIFPLEDFQKLEGIKNSRSDPMSKVLLMIVGIGIFFYYKLFSKGHD